MLAVDVSVSSSPHLSVPQHLVVLLMDSSPPWWVVEEAPVKGVQLSVAHGGIGRLMHHGPSHLLMVRHLFAQQSKRVTDMFSHCVFDTWNTLFCPCNKSE